MEATKKHLLSLVDTSQYNINTKGLYGVNLSLFREVDTEKTRQKADDLLLRYRSCLRIACAGYEPKVTATYSIEPITHSNVNHNRIDDNLILQEEARNVVDDILKAYNSLNADERALIYDKYLSKRRLVDYKIYIKYNWSEATFYRELKKVLVMFAEAYRGGKLLVFGNDRDLIDF
ncbi:ArpU family transcriptional regulator [Ligilactobacillus sp. WILCCON 0076]|uniref:ArpU family transcriptional regulator n=1 Tax=Ligilactobacillus ubinensis TaxID=2876789 RepID=A0A9X2FJT9_9LACO|nr:ArpU family phage packaging/lysis transcriptional regulator [Ligilactobacillus ubinensis]MCP0886946.1 ArpU family transcriptional regulator [Ligilactobacillus ubinensis]